MRYIFHHNKNLDAKLDYYNEMLNDHDGQECKGRKYNSKEDLVDVTFSDGIKLVAFGRELEVVRDGEQK